MKTKTFFLLLLMMVVGMNQLSAQNGKGSGNKTDVYNFLVPEIEVSFDIICDDKLVDVLVNTDAYYIKCRDHYKNGVWTAWNMHLNNVAFISEKTGEVFKLQGTERGTMEGMDYTFGNLIGNNGSHYIMNIIMDPKDEWRVVDASFRCH